jgi:tellurite resistance protein
MFLAELRPEEKTAFLELANLVASVDGNLSIKEDLLIEDYRYEMGLEHYLVQNLTMDEILQLFTSERSKNIALAEILGLIFSDGVFHEQEKESVRLIKKHFGFDPNQYKSFKDWVDKIKQLSEEPAS